MNKNCLQYLFFSVLMLSFSSINAASLMYVSTGETNELVIIDVDTDKVIKRIGELENAHGLSTSSNTKYLVAGSMKIMEPDKKLKASKPDAVSEAVHEAHHSGGKDGGKDAAKVMAAPSYVSGQKHGK
ncbi:MAG: hypothetical protein GXP19_08680 [Gammaproteobacteria bacterium]|nr:hypothetical protein [Gammaproteobacteria bacterium]